MTTEKVYENLCRLSAHMKAGSKTGKMKLILPETAEYMELQETLEKAADLVAVNLALEKSGGITLGELAKAHKRVSIKKRFEDYEREHGHPAPKLTEERW